MELTTIRSDQVLWAHVSERNYVLETGKVLELSFGEILSLDGKKKEEYNR